ncbi:elongation of very long chain fatty acids protein 7-like [Nilaparvata lugens]|uniref:Elongation of very long chain fatty acids protein n=1 Tax=Nilaparvata lugens TaxID=108931 RepID=A0A3S7L469_NILLU|nr:elongation of very long chain fatty acids protein 7-like [Nilaparvata lugens]AWJ25035.1 fatty acid elongase [Nilaparvata lugens]
MDTMKLRVHSGYDVFNHTAQNVTVEEDKLVNSWFLMSNPGPMLTLLAVYLLFVLKIGPRFMSSRKPFQLKTIMMLYNVFQIFCNSYIVISFLFHTEGHQYLLKHGCQPAEMNTNVLRIDMCVGYWRYTIMKFIDLIDTVFFVLRKKNSHMTFLHVYHHCGMALFSWCCLKYFRGEQGVLLGVMNCGVHVIMYTYYFLAGLGEEMRKRLWWKKYITTIQMGQFCIGLVYIGSLIAFGCNLPRGFSLFWALNLVIFLALFLNFYNRTYSRKPAADTVKPVTPTPDAEKTDKEKAN